MTENHVPWAFMSYAEICKSKMLEQVRDWIKFELNPGEQRDNYIKYLKSNCGFPSTFMGASE